MLSPEGLLQMANRTVLILNKKDHFIILFIFKFNMIGAWGVEFRVSCMIYYHRLVVVVCLSSMTRRIYLVCVHLFGWKVNWVWLRYHVCELIASHIFKLNFDFFYILWLFLWFYNRNFFNISTLFLLILFLFLIFVVDLSAIKLLNIFRMCLISIINAWCCFCSRWRSNRVSNLFLF